MSAAVLLQFYTDVLVEYGGGGRSTSQGVTVLVSFGLADLTMGVA